MKQTLIIFPDERLDQVSDPFDLSKPEEVELLKKTATDLLDTLNASKTGVGLAAVQIGIAKRIFIMREPDKTPIYVINPEIVEVGEEVEVTEGCLSFPNYFVKGTRPGELAVSYNEYTPNGDLPRREKVELKDLAAHIFDHENDHLNGITMADLFLNEKEYKRVAGRLNKWRRAGWMWP